MWPFTVQQCLLEREKKCHQHCKGIVSEIFYDIADTELSRYQCTSSGFWLNVRLDQYVMQALLEAGTNSNFP